MKKRTLRRRIKELTRAWTRSDRAHLSARLELQRTQAQVERLTIALTVASTELAKHGVNVEQWLAEHRPHPEAHD